jgi:hypothetical protein
MKFKMEIEAPTFDLGIESDSKDLLNLIVEDSLEKRWRESIQSHC